MLDLGTPDDFRGDPYGWLTNQMSHVLAGLGGTWLVALLVRSLGLGSGNAASVAVAVTALASGALEARQLRRGGSLRDGVEDFVFVVAGALWTASGGVLALWLVVVGGLARGTGRRANEAARLSAIASED